MSFLKKLFGGKAAEPVAQWQHPLLGNAIWIGPNECWCGQVGEVPYSIGYIENKTGEPDESVVQYATEVFSDATITSDGFVQARSKAIMNYGEHYRQEIEGLTIGAIYFYLDEDGCGMNLTMLGGQMGRSWSAEFTGKHCIGIVMDD